LADKEYRAWSSFPDYQQSRDLNSTTQWSVLTQRLRLRFRLPAKFHTQSRWAKSRDCSSYWDLKVEWCFPELCCWANSIQGWFVQGLSDQDLSDPAMFGESRYRPVEWPFWRVELPYWPAESQCFPAASLVIRECCSVPRYCLNRPQALLRPLNFGQSPNLHNTVQQIAT
jgi:hypothetical protein